MANHLAIYNRKLYKVDYIEMMLTGRKNIGIKLANRKIAPFGKITPGDYMYIKEASGPVVGRVRIPKVENFVLEPESPDLLDILLDIWQGVGLRDEAHAESMYRKNSEKKYATVFALADPEKLDNPVQIYKRSRQTWVANYELPFDLRAAFEI